MIAAYLADLDLAGDARVLEVSCGTGAIARDLVTWPGVGEVLGLDSSPILLDRARRLGAGIDNLSFQEGDGRRLSLPDAAFDAVVLSHVPGPEGVLAEAFRVLRPGGRLAVFDGDHATITLATGDPTRSTAAWRRSGRPTSPIRGGSGGCPRSCTPPALPTAAYAAAASSRSTTPTTMLSIADRGADTLAASGTIGPEPADALKAEGRRRVAAHAFYGHVAYAGLTARKPDEG